jgi:hypothetical protein
MPCGYFAVLKIIIQMIVKLVDKSTCKDLMYRARATATQAV